MTNLTTEQIREILDGAPDGATHTGLVQHYYMIEEFKGRYFFYLYKNEEWFQVHNLPRYVKDLSDLREILALRERVEELEANIDMALTRNSMSYLLRKPKDNTNERD